MSDLKPLKISAKNLGYTALESFCPRCYWIKLQMSHNLPWSSFPGIFSSIDAFTKHCVHEMIDEGLNTGNVPLWLQDMGKMVKYEQVPHWSKSLCVDEKSGITISGMADDIFVLDDGTFVVPDYKTAKYTASQDELLPMYEIQEICYPIIYGYKNAKLFLVYMEPQTEANKAYSCVTKSGFDMGFSAKTVPVENDRKKVRRAFEITREIYEMAEAPKDKDWCKECEKMDKVMELIKGKEE